MTNPFAVIAWTKSPEAERDKVTSVLTSACSKLAHAEAERDEEPSAEYGAFAAARELLWHLKKEANVLKVPEDFRQGMKTWIAGPEKGTEEGVCATSDNLLRHREKETEEPMPTNDVASKEFYRVLDHLEIQKLDKGSKVEPERGVRLHGTYHGCAVVVSALQLRAPLKLMSGKEGQDFVIATASMDRAALTALRDAIDEQLAVEPYEEG